MAGIVGERLVDFKTVEQVEVGVIRLVMALDELNVPVLSAELVGL